MNGREVLSDMRDSAGTPRDMSTLQTDAIRALFADRDVGVWWFCREIFGFRDLRWDLHGPVCQLVGHWGESRLANNKIIDHTPRGGYEEDNIADSYRRIMFRIPRECFKTSVVTRGGGLWTLTQNPNATIGIFNETQEKPIQWIDAIRQVVEGSQLFQVVYRDLLPKGIGFWDRDNGVTTSRKLKWGGMGMRFERDDIGVAELSLEPHGIMGTAVGKHFTHMIWDDIIGLKAAQSNAIMEAAVEWVDNSRAIERPLEGGCVMVPHTTWAFHDVYKHMEHKWPGEWRILHRSLLENPETGEPDDLYGESIFPEKISTKKAYKMRDADTFVFAAQYQCEPKAGRSQSFNPEWDGAFHIVFEGKEPVIHIDSTGGFPGYNGEIFEHDMADCPDYAPQRVPLSWCAKSIILDPAPSKGPEVRANRHARNGFVVCAIDPWGRRYNLDSKVSQDTPQDILDEMIILARKWRAWTWSIEEVTFSAVYQYLWQSIMSLRDDYRELRPEWRPVFPEGREKEGRIRNALIHIHETGLVYYNRGQPDSVDRGCPSGYLLKEKDEFPHGQTVDCLDAFAYIDESIFKPQTPDQITKAWWRNKHGAGERGVTGYGEMTYESSG